MTTVQALIASSRTVGGGVGESVPEATSNQGVSNPGVFIAAESLTFSSAAAVCAAIVGGLRLFTGDADNAFWVLGVCTAVGAIIIALGWPRDDQSSPAKPQRYFTYVAIGALNVFLLFVSVMGIIAASSQGVPGVPL